MITSLLNHNFGQPTLVTVLSDKDKLIRAVKEDARILQEDMPKDKLVVWSMKLFFAERLAWGYVDTIIDLCIQMKIKATRPLVRTIRQIYKGYESSRKPKMYYSDEEWKDKKDWEANEIKNAEEFEANFESDFDRLFYGLEMDVKKLDLTPEYQAFIIAVQQALTIMDAVKLYSAWLDKKAREYNLWKDRQHSFMHVEFRRLYTLIPQFAGDCYNPDLEARKITANILFNRLMSVECTAKINGKEYTLT